MDTTHYIVEFALTFWGFGHHWEIFTPLKNSSDDAVLE